MAVDEQLASGIFAADGCLRAIRLRECDGRAVFERRAGKIGGSRKLFPETDESQFGLHVRRSDFPHLRIPGEGRAESREHERAEHAEDNQRADDFQQRETPLGGADIRTHGKAPRNRA